MSLVALVIGTSVTAAATERVTILLVAIAESSAGRLPRHS
jgi:hypothetical protein